MNGSFFFVEQINKYIYIYIYTYIYIYISTTNLVVRETMCQAFCVNAYTPDSFRSCILWSMNRGVVHALPVYHTKKIAMCIHFGGVRVEPVNPSRVLRDVVPATLTNEIQSSRSSPYKVGRRSVDYTTLGHG